MIRVFLCICGKEQQRHQCTCRIKVPRRCLKKRHMEICFQERSQKSAISEYLAPLYLFTFPRKRGQSWTLLDRRAYLLVTVTHRRHTRYIFPVSGKLRLVEMSPAMRVQSSTNQNMIVQKRFMRRRMKLLEFQRQKQLN